MEPPAVLEWAGRLNPDTLTRLRSCRSPLSLLVLDNDATPWIEPFDLLSLLPAAPPEPGRIILAEADGTLLLARAIAKLPNGKWRARQDRMDTEERIVSPLGVVVRIHRTDGARACQNAKARAVEIKFHVMGTDDLDFPSETFDGVFIGWEIYSHIPGYRRRVETLRCVRRLLKRDGVLLLFQSWRQYTTWISRARLVDTIRRFGRVILGDRLSEPGDDLIRGVAASGAYLPLAFYHHFRDADEIQIELEAGGFVASLTNGLWIARPR